MWDINRNGHDKMQALQFELIRTRVGILDCLAPGSVDPLPHIAQSGPFLDELSRASVRFWLDGGDGDYTGPYVQVVECLRGALAVAMLGQYKQARSSSSFPYFRHAEKVFRILTCYMRTDVEEPRRAL